MERLRKMRKINNQNTFAFSPSFYVNMTPVRKHVLSFKYVLCIVLYFLCQVKIRTQKSDFNITRVNRRPMGTWYIYILDDASQSQHPLQFTLTRLWPDTWAGLCRPATLNTTQLNKLIYSNNPKTSKTVKVPRMCHVKIQCLFFSARTPLSGSGLWFMSFRSFREKKSSWEAWGTLVPNQRFYNEQHDF